jgi:hypothetical protein
MRMAFGPRTALTAKSVAMDVVLLQFHARRSADAVQRVLGSAVGGHVRHGDVSGDTGDVDDGAASLLLHHRHHRLHALDGAEQIGVEHPPALAHVHLGDGIHQPVTGVVHPDVDPAIP